MEGHSPKNQHIIYVSLKMKKVHNLERNDHKQQEESCINKQKSII